MKKNLFSGIIFFFIVIFSAILLRKSVKTSDNKVAKDILFVGDLLITFRFIAFILVILLIIGLSMHKK